MIAVIDYDAGNIKSVEKALLFLGEQVCVTREREKILRLLQTAFPSSDNAGNSIRSAEPFRLLSPVSE